MTLSSAVYEILLITRRIDHKKQEYQNHSTHRTRYGLEATRKEEVTRKVQVGCMDVSALILFHAVHRLNDILLGVHYVTSTYSRTASSRREK